VIHAGCDECHGASLVQVIRVVCTRGEAGRPDNPVREVVQFWSTDGKLLAERDIFHRRSGATREAFDHTEKCRQCGAEGYKLDEFLNPRNGKCVNCQ